MLSLTRIHALKGVKALQLRQAVLSYKMLSFLKRKGVML